jgi:hypothetical protein
MQQAVAHQPGRRRDRATLDASGRYWVIHKQPPDRAEWYRRGMVPAIETHDFTRVFRLLQKVGYSQQRIAVLTDQAQPEISSIIYGRRIQAYHLVKRIVAGLGIPACLAGVSSCCYCCEHQYGYEQDQAPGDPPVLTSPRTQTRARTPSVR